MADHELISYSNSSPSLDYCSDEISTFCKDDDALGIAKRLLDFHQTPCPLAQLQQDAEDHQLHSFLAVATFPRL